MGFRLILMLLLVACAACGGDIASSDTSGASTTTVSGSTEAATTTTATVDQGEGLPPWGLDATVMPDDAAAVGAVFAALPNEIAGLTRNDVQGRVQGAFEVEYGDAGRAIRATPVAAIATPGNDELTSLAWLETMAGAMEGEVEGRVLDADAPLVWIASAEQADDETAFFAAWCVPDGSWYFDAVAETAAARLGLIRAFIAAVESA